MKNKNPQTVEFFNYFDNIYVNNLPYRKDRLDAFDHFAREFDFDYQVNVAKWGPTAYEEFMNDPEAYLQRFAHVVDIKPYLKTYQSYVDKYQKGNYQSNEKQHTHGCSISNALIILHAHDNNYEKVFLFEDDAQPTTNFPTYAGQVINELKSSNWSFISFGTPHKHFEGDPHQSSNYRFRKYDDNETLYRIFRGQAALLHSYAVHSSFYKTFIEIALSTLFGHLDNRISSYCGSNNLLYLASYPALFVQSSNFSDIQQEPKKKWGTYPQSAVKQYQPIVFEQYRKYNMQLEDIHRYNLDTLDL